MHSVAVAGSGVLGAQIAFQCAYRGFNVSVYDFSSEALAKLPKKWRQLADIYQREVGATAEAAQSAIARLLSTDDLEVALRDADILIEAIPEDVEIKKEFFRRATQMAPAKTIFATNSSTPCRAYWPPQPIGRSGFSRCTSPTTSGGRMSPKSCGTTARIRRSSTRSRASRRGSGWCRS